ncbi:MAG TPA: YdcF family protein [Chloroflexia bacterium]|nr:YdcF family protein [Chloroflexia bacterium]
MRRSRLRTAISIVLLLLVMWVGLDFAYVSIGAETDYAIPADVIIVLGCRIHGDASGGFSYCIRARADHAADLYKRDLSDHIIATGGATEDGRGPTESSVLYGLLRQDGVPESAIIQESQAHNTIQNLSYSQAIMQENGWRTAILVTEPFHINRATLIARDAGMTIYPSPALDTPNWTQPLVRVYNLSRDTLSLMLYQVKWLVGVQE